MLEIDNRDPMLSELSKDGVPFAVTELLFVDRAVDRTLLDESINDTVSTPRQVLDTSAQAFISPLHLCVAVLYGVSHDRR